MDKKWNERYRNEAYAYGTEPNAYFQSKLMQLPAGHLVLPAEGEGRNAVYAASNGWKVTAFDISEEGRKKALKLAAASGVTFDYHVGEFQQIPAIQQPVDALAFMYAHFPAEIKSGLNKAISRLLRPGGHLIFEAFSKRHLQYLKANPAVGGPADIHMLYSLEEIREDFADFTVLELEETEITLQEGLFHNGLASVIRFLGRKKG